MSRNVVLKVKSLLSVPTVSGCSKQIDHIGVFGDKDVEGSALRFLALLILGGSWL